MKLIQQTPHCSDFDVILDGERNPAFRVLLPEFVRADGLDLGKLLHTIPGKWFVGRDGATGSFRASPEILISVTIECRGMEIAVNLNLKNLSSQPLVNLKADVCASVNHLPGEPGWCNPAFFPASLALDRDVQGRYWYEKITPHNLMALTDGGWVEMHPAPRHPDASRVAQYSFVPSSEESATACTVASADGRFLFFQAWDTRCNYCTPCPGNACMHLHPLIAARLEPGAAASVRGRVGIFRGSREEWARAAKTEC